MKKTVIAIFEDDIVNRFIYEQAFRPYRDQAEIHIFERPDKGIDVAVRSPFDIVIIEAHFWENFGGIRILNSLKQSAEGNPLYIAITSLLQPGDLELLTRAGFTMCLEKPIVLSEVIAGAMRQRS